MQRFGLDDVQAQAILDMRLKALGVLDQGSRPRYKELERRSPTSSVSSATRTGEVHPQEAAPPLPTSSKATTTRRRYRT